MQKKAIQYAFSIIWENKKLWLLGILASFTGAMEEASLLTRATTAGSGSYALSFWQELQQTKNFSQTGLHGLQNLISRNPFSFFQIILFLSIALIVAGAIIWASLASQGSIIYIAQNPNAIKKNTLREMLSFGKKKFWQILWLNIFAKILIFLFLLSTHFLLATQSSYIFLSSVALTLIVYVAISFFIKYAACGIMVKHHSIFSALKYSFRACKKNIISSFGLSLLLFAISAATLVLGTLATLIISIPFLAIMAAAFFLHMSGIIIFVFLLFLFVATVFFFILQGFLSAFSWCAWTHMFAQLKK